MFIEVSTFLLARAGFFFPSSRIGFFIVHIPDLELDCALLFGKEMITGGGFYVSIAKAGVTWIIFERLGQIIDAFWLIFERPNQIIDAFWLIFERLSQIIGAFWIIFERLSQIIVSFYSFIIIWSSLKAGELLFLFRSLP